MESSSFSVVRDLCGCDSKSLEGGVHQQEEEWGGLGTEALVRFLTTKKKNLLFNLLSRQEKGMCPVLTAQAFWVVVVRDSIVGFQ